ncbi:MAG TPA: SEC-C metal-binding domain-containing protein [Thermodesulfovibrionales bacterium]|nr:SEC-C metal-binding domain-containing protein [Thermodesulfovibrionales bacterium]
MGFIESIKSYFLGTGQEGPSARPGRNEPCWCGSGTKYKKCHLNEDDKKGRNTGATPGGPR